MQEFAAMKFHGSAPEQNVAGSSTHITLDEPKPPSIRVSPQAAKASTIACISDFNLCTRLLRSQIELVQTKLALGHGEVMKLVMCALHHDPHEPQGLDFHHLLSVVARNDELDATREVLDSRAPPDLA